MELKQKLKGSLGPAPFPLDTKDCYPHFSDEATEAPHQKAPSHMGLNVPNSLTLLSHLHGPPEASWKPLPGRGKWGPEATSVGFSIRPKSLSCP